MIFIDCEGDPIQEFSAIYVNEKTHDICDVFHYYVKYPSSMTFDGDKFARFHIHGLNLDYLSSHGLESEDELRVLFIKWLKKWPSSSCIYAHAPFKEKTFLNISVQDVSLPSWKERCDLQSHQTALFMKVNHVPILNVVCKAHTSFKGWKAKRPYCMNATDVAKCNFLFHCSLYDCIECFLFYCK